MRFCSNCKYFKLHNYKYNYKRRVVAGHWVGDGKCQRKNSIFKYVILGHSCQYFEKRERTKEEMKILEEVGRRQNEKQKGNYYK